MKFHWKKLGWLIYNWRRYSTFQPWATKKIIRTEGLIYPGAFLRKLQKIEVTGPKKAQFWMFLEKFTKNQYFYLVASFFCTFFKTEYTDHSRNFLFFEILCSSNFFFELRLDDVLEVLVVGFNIFFYKTCG